MLSGAHSDSDMLCHINVFLSSQIREKQSIICTPMLSISFNIRYSSAQVVENARICFFGEHVSNPNCCSVMILNSTREEEVIAHTGYRAFGAVACLNGE